MTALQLSRVIYRDVVKLERNYADLYRDLSTGTDSPQLHVSIFYWMKNKRIIVSRQKKMISPRLF